LYMMYVQHVDAGAALEEFATEVLRGARRAA
jgi:hypothetical protein